jgi:hypothetical protein
MFLHAPPSRRIAYCNFPQMFLPQSRAADRRRCPHCGCLPFDQYLPSPRPSGWSLVIIGPGNQYQGQLL